MFGTGYDPLKIPRRVDDVGISVGDRSDFAAGHSNTALLNVEGTLLILQEMRSSSSVPSAISGDSTEITSWNAEIDAAIVALKTASTNLNDALDRIRTAQTVT